MLYKLRVGEVLHHCILEHKVEPIPGEAHDGAIARHRGVESIAQKILLTGLWWSMLFEDADKWVKTCDVWQRVGRPLK